MEEPTPVPDAPIDLNDVTRDQLEGRFGLAPDVSEAIVAFRAKHGPWTDIEQLMEIPGIDPSVVDALRQWVYVAPPGDAAGPTSDEHAPVPEQSLDEQAESCQPEPDNGPAVPGLEPAEPGGADVYSGEEVVAIPESVDAVLDRGPGSELALEPGGMGLEPIESPSAVYEPEDCSAMAPSSAPATDYAESTPVPAGEEARWFESVPGRDPGVGPGATERPEDGRPVAAVDGLFAPAEELSEKIPSGPERPVPPLSFEPGQSEAMSAEAEEPPDEVEGDAAPWRAPGEYVEQRTVYPGATETAATTAAVRRRSVWHDIGMIALGGLVGALLTLLILGGMGGTLSYAPRRLVDALSQNMSIMQDNQETTWSQLQALTLQADTLEKRMGALEGLDGRVAELESGSEALGVQLGNLSGDVDELSASLASLETRHAALIKGLETRMGSQQREIDALDEAMGALRDTVQQMQDVVDKYESFFDALRDLLIDMQGDAVAESGA
ncbi:MAG: helix-hairpin-helix domain-containing protein [Anaerolineae bacterium]